MGDFQHSTSMLSTNDHQQSWSLNGDAEETQLYETQYPVSEWDTNLDMLLDELQESVSSPQNAKGRKKITALPTIAASERQSPNKPVSSSTNVLSSSQFLQLAEEALRQTTIARRLLESIADEPTAALPSNPTSASSSLSFNTSARLQPPEKETQLTDKVVDRLATESENNPATSASERVKTWTTRRVQTVQPPTTPEKTAPDGKSTESFATAEGLRSFKLHPATVEDIETALTNLKIATDNKKILTYTEHMEYTQVPSNSDITGPMISEEKPVGSEAADFETPSKYSADSLKILGFTDLLSSIKINATAELPSTGTDEGKLLVSPSNSTESQKVFESKAKSKTSPSDIDEWEAKLAQLDSALNLLIEGLDKDNH